MAKKSEQAQPKIVHANEGAKINYEFDGNRLTLGDDELTVNIERHERDDANHIDVCRHRLGSLVMGVIPGTAEAYVAQLDIPPREYDYISDGFDDEGNPKEVKMPIPFDIGKCTLTLWALV